MNDSTILEDTKNFVLNSPENLFCLFFSTNYQAYSIGAAIVKDSSFIWIENSNSPEDNLVSQYGFDSQGYGESVCVSSISSSGIPELISIVSEYDRDFKHAPIDVYTKEQLTMILNSIKHDGELVELVSNDFHKRITEDTELIVFKEN